MEEVSSRTWKLSEAVKRCFSKEPRRIAIPTVQSWMREKIFVPYRKAAERNPKGSYLSLSDLVFLSLLSALFSIGVRFTAVQGGGILDGTKDVYGFVANDKQSATIVMMAGHTLTKDEQNRVRRECHLKKRPIQSYIETPSIAYDAQIWIRFSPEKSIKHSLIFFPSEDFEEVCKLVEQRSDDMGIDMFLKIKPHFEYIKLALDIK